MNTLAEHHYNATASKILLTAKHLFMQRGYRAVSINDIVKAAEVTKPTLYYHFADKEELYVQMALHLVNEMHEAMWGKVEQAEGIEAKLIAFAQGILNRNDGDTRMMRREMDEHLSTQQRRRIAEAFRSKIYYPLVAVMQQGIDEGLLSIHNAFELGVLFMGMLEGFQGDIRQDEGNERLVNQPDVPFDHQIMAPESIVRLFLYGVARG